MIINRVFIGQSDFSREPGHYGCNICGAEIWCSSQPRYCPMCQEVFIRGKLPSDYQQLTIDEVRYHNESVMWESIAQTFEEVK